MRKRSCYFRNKVVLYNYRKTLCAKGRRNSKKYDEVTKMKKKVFATLLAVSMIASMVPAAVSVQAADGDTIRLVNGKIEVDAQLKKLAEMYEKETGTKVEIESMGGGIDIQGTLKGYYQSDNMPDIFVNGGATDFANWTDLLVDMSDQDWASDTDAAYVDDEQGTIGFPYTT